MKNKRFIAVAAIAILMIGAMSAFTPHSIKAANSAGATQVQTCDQQDDDSAEVPGAEDSDTVELQCGDQTEDSGADEEEAVSSPEMETAESATLLSKAAISSVEAETIALSANPGATVQNTELDDENGAVVYSVELSSGADVKVDAANGSILTIDSDMDNEG